MYTANNQKPFNLHYNGPHEVRVTSQTGISETIRNISFEKNFYDVSKDNSSNEAKKVLETS